MPEPKKPVAKAAETEPVALGRASESSDPAVHKLLGDRQTAVLNGDEAGIDAADAALKDRGFAV